MKAWSLAVPRTGRHIHFANEVAQGLHVAGQGPIVGIVGDFFPHHSVDRVGTRRARPAPGQKIMGLRGRHEFDRQDVFGVVDDRQQLVGGDGRMRQKILLQAGCDAANRSPPGRPDAD